MTGELTITAVAGDELDLVEDLWRSLYRHHRSLSGAFEAVTPPRSEDESWRSRQRFYAEVLASGGVALVARSGGQPIGYAVVSIRPGESGSWTEPAQVAVLETLTVADRLRGGGVGSRLIDAVRRVCSERHVTQVEVGVLAANERAVGFYVRHGFTSFLTTMIAVNGRGGT